MIIHRIYYELCGALDVSIFMIDLVWRSAREHVDDEKNPLKVIAWNIHHPSVLGLIKCMISLFHTDVDYFQ